MIWKSSAPVAAPIIVSASPSSFAPYRYVDPNANLRDYGERVLEA